MIPLTTQSEIAKEKSSKRFWLTLILSFFALDLTIAIYAIVVAVSDPSFRPMPDYGDRSVAWEVHHQEQLASERLGWTVAVSRVETSDQAIEFRVVDRSGEPIVHATGLASAYHFTRVADQQTSPLEEREAGCYVANIDCRRPGLWKIDLRLTRTPETTAEESRPADVFVYEATIEFPITHPVVTSSLPSSISS
ncbi:MAG: FixH family protein [Pirellulaceae bacterium]|nr:FixH family protein [Pirellulaceae bacterium]